MRTKMTLSVVVVFMTLSLSIQSQNYVDFEKGSRTIWAAADFSDWSKSRSENGNTDVDVYNRYILTSNNSAGTGGNSEITELPGDFILDFSFKFIVEKTGALSFILSGVGSNYFQFRFYCYVNQLGNTTFTIKEEWVTNDFYVSEKREIASNKKVPEQYISNIDWYQNNKISIKRKGSQITYYVNGQELMSFPAAIFTIKELGVALAGQSIVEFTFIEARIPIN